MIIQEKGQGKQKILYVIILIFLVISMVLQIKVLKEISEIRAQKEKGVILILNPEIAKDTGVAYIPPCEDRCEREKEALKGKE
jgi:hypothetical protein